MRPHRLVCLLVAALLLTGVAARPQSSHRRIGPKPPAPPNVFDQLEKRHGAERQQELAQEAAARNQRHTDRAELARDLNELMGLAQKLQTQLDSTDLDKTLPVGLRQQSDELERLARRIHKRVRGL